MPDITPANVALWLVWPFLVFCYVCLWAGLIACMVWLTHASLWVIGQFLLVGTAIEALEEAHRQGRPLRRLIRLQQWRKRWWS